MREPLVHILVVNWNGMDHLEACFRSLLATPYENVRFVLLDNASADGSAAFVRDSFGQDPRVQVLELAENLGWSRGNNVGIEAALAAHADYVMLLNNDTAVAPDMLATLVRHAEAQPQAGCLAPKMLLFDQPDLLNSVGMALSLIGSCWDIGLGRIDRPRWNTPCKVAGACGGAAFFRAEAIRRAGLLPSDFDIYLDDLDLCLRVWKAGYEIWSCPEAIVRHKYSATMGQGEQLRRKYYLNTRNRIRLIRRNFPVEVQRAVMIRYGLGECRAVGRGILDGDLWKLGVHARCWRDALTYRGQGSERPANGAACPFWPLVLKRPLFFPGIELPQDGWYAPVHINGAAYHPMARRALYRTQGGPLRIGLTNCYPDFGLAEVTVHAEGQPLAQLQTVTKRECIVETPAATIELVAKRIFDAEQTGLHHDTGGWVSIASG